jgi:hypothetical protein
MATDDMADHYTASYDFTKKVIYVLANVILPGVGGVNCEFPSF